MASSCTSAFSAAESGVSQSTKGFHEPNRTLVNSPGSPPCSELSVPFSSQLGHALSGNISYTLDQELIPPTSRLSRLPCPQTTFSSTTGVAIPASQTNSTHTNTGHDVHDFVNNSAFLTSSSAPRNFGLLPNSPETTVSSPTQLLTHNAISHPIRRPRTHNQVFQSSKDLAAHYGIPEILPPAPRTTTATIQQSAKSSIHLDFQTLSSNYLSMLSRNPADNTNMTDSTTPAITVTHEDLGDPVIPDDDDMAKTLAAMFEYPAAGPESGPAGWDMTTPSLVDDFSPWSPDITNPYLSTPQDTTLDTPVFKYLDESYMLTGPDYATASLFPSFPHDWPAADNAAPPPKSVPELDVSTLISMSPASPHLHSFDPPEPSIAPKQIDAPSVPSTVLPRRKVTGIRKGVTPESLLDETAPTQSRSYATPSATSRKEVPAVFARKRARSTAFGDEEDQLEEYVLPPNPTEKDLIEQKRRQNTVAARRSRKRKLEHVQLLEKSLEEEKQEKERWRQRTLMLMSMLSGLNQPVPDFSADL